MDIVSACLVGCHCRYDGGEQQRADLLQKYKAGELLPICPEQLGGLPTPRNPAEQIEQKLITNQGQDVTREYQRGAAEALRLGELLGIQKAYLKSRSPMCGKDQIYDGTFTGQLTTGNGVFTQLLLNKGIEVISVD